MLRSFPVTRPPAKEQNPPIPSDFVPLPSPDNGLAKLIADVSPPSALTFSTPFIRVPVTAPPSFAQSGLDAHREVASRRWHAGWTPRERQRVLAALDVDRSTLGQRYLNMSSRHGWLMLALERAQVGWEGALYVAEQLTAPPLDWFTLDQAATSYGALRPEAGWVPELGDPRGPRERVVTDYRSMAVAVYADLGADRPLWWFGPVPEDENRRPSRLLDASAACGVTKRATANPSRGARKARKRGRRLLHAVGAWPWAHYPSGVVEDNWWTAARVVEQLATWRSNGEALADGAWGAREAAARALSL